MPVALASSYTGGTGALSDTESASVAGYAGGYDGNGITLSGGPDGVTTAATVTRYFSGMAAVGSGTGSFAVNVTPELSGSSTVTAAYSIAVTSGSMLWTNVSGGSWSAGGNWADTVAGGAPVAPGLNSHWTSSDVANFASSSGSAVTITLDQAPSLAAVNFGGSDSYKLTEGTLTLSGTNSATSAATVAGGTHSIASAVYLTGGNLAVSESGSGLLGISGNVSDDGGSRSLTLEGDGTGTLVLSGTNTFGGGTNVNAGTLIVTTNTALLDGSSLTVGAGGTFIFDPAASASSLTAAPQVRPAGVEAVPEPGTIALLAAALCAAAACRHIEVRSPRRHRSRSTGGQAGRRPSTSD